MGVKQYDEYVEQLAVLGQWDPPNIFGVDVAEKVRLLAGSNMVASQGIQILQQVWKTLPISVRDQMVGGLVNIGMELANAGKEGLDSYPVIGQIVAAGLDNAMKIAEASRIITDHKRAKSNYTHGKSQAWTIRNAFGTADPGGENAAWAIDTGFKAYPGGLYTRAPVFEYAQFVKVRAGGDFDRKPGFKRPGGARDSIFLGNPSPVGSGCKEKIRRSGSESYGPFWPKCGRTIGLSASLWPWWSAAYEPGPLTRWITPPEAEFQEPPSPNTNLELTNIQSALIIDPEKNLLASFTDVHVKSYRFLSWWKANSNRVYRIYEGIVQAGESKKIDASKVAGHSLSKSADSYWYYDSSGYIRTYEGQLGGKTDMGTWGVALPPGDPADLGVTLEQHNAVISQRAAFAQRRLATLRTPGLVRAIIQDAPGGINGLDSSARDAILYSKDSNASVLPYPGAITPAKAAGVRKPTKKMIAQVDGGGPKRSVVPVLAAAAVAAFLIYKRVWK